ncbi:nuclear transport factor 2 family protein [Ferruginibacter sp.]
MSQLTTNEEKVLAFIKMMEEQRPVEELDEFYHPDVEQTEFSNAIVKNTVVRKLADLKAGAERGRKIMQREEYEIKKLHTAGDTVILEAIWKGTLSIAIGNIPAGGQMTAYFAQFFEFKNGKIFRQRNYDCFDPF